MKRLISSISLSIIFGLIVLACGLSQAEPNTTRTQVAANIYATQTANAQIVMITSTPTPTSTGKPTGTATASPLPTNTPTITLTPTPYMMSLVITLDDLPEGFIAIPAEEMRDLVRNLSEDAIAFGFSDEAGENLVMGQLIPYSSRVEQNAFDAMMPEFMDLFPAVLGAETTPEPILGLEDLGDSRASTTFLSEIYSMKTRWEIVAFRRGEIAVILYIGYLEGEEPGLEINAIANLLDERIDDLTVSFP